MGTQLKRPGISIIRSRPARMLLGLLFLGSSVQSGFALNKQEVKRQLVVVGYDLANNAAAMDVLNRMGEAARAAGGAGKVIMADKNEQALNAALTDAMNTVTRQQPTQPALKVIERAPALPGRVVVQHSAGSASNLQSWIGFYRADAPNNEYISYTFLKNLTDCKYDVQIEEPGQYNFRLFMDEGYAPTATSEVLEFK